MWEWLKDGLGKFGGFQAMNFGRTLVVSFWLLILALGGQDCGRMMRHRR